MLVQSNSASLLCLLALLICVWAAAAVKFSQREMTELSHQLSAITASMVLGARIQPVLVAETAPSSLVELVHIFPDSNNSKLAMSRLYQAAEKQQLVLYQGEYHLLHDKRGGPAMYEIELPVKASYTQLRHFIAQALSDIPSLALDDVSFKRQKIDDPMLDAQLKFTLYLRDE